LRKIATGSAGHRRNPEFSPGVYLSEIAAVPRTQTDRGVLKEVET
jgi:hypothetical protein